MDEHGGIRFHHHLLEVSKFNFGVFQMGTIHEHRNKTQHHQAADVRNRDVIEDPVASLGFRIKVETAASEEAQMRKKMVGSGDRSQRIRTYNYPQGRITDHRINLTLYKLDDVMMGKLDEVILPLIAYYQAETLKTLQ